MEGIPWFYLDGSWGRTSAFLIVLVYRPVGFKGVTVRCSQRCSRRGLYVRR